MITDGTRASTELRVQALTHKLLPAARAFKRPILLTVVDVASGCGPEVATLIAVALYPPDCKVALATMFASSRLACKPVGAPTVLASIRKELPRGLKASRLERIIADYADNPMDQRLCISALLAAS
jgi:hypothetical protein